MPPSDLKEQGRVQDIRALAFCWVRSEGRGQRAGMNIGDREEQLEQLTRGGSAAHFVCVMYVYMHVCVCVCVCACVRACVHVCAGGACSKRVY